MIECVKWEGDFPPYPLPGLRITPLFGTLKFIKGETGISSGKWEASMLQSIFQNVDTETPIPQTG